MSIVSSITSSHIQRITIGFVDQVTDAQLKSAVELKTWCKFDDAITLLAERTLNNGRKLQLELHVCGNPSTELFDLVLPGFVESGCLKVVKTSYIWKGSILYLPFLSKRNKQFWLAFISGPSIYGLRDEQEVL